MSGDVVGVPKFILIPAVFLIFGVGVWSGVQEWRIGDLEEENASLDQEVQLLKTQYALNQQEINSKLTKIHANVVTIANARGTRLPFPDSDN